MQQRLRALFRLRPQHLYTLEAVLTGVMFLQALRFLVPMLYSRIEGAAVVASLPADILTPEMLTAANPAVVSVEITLLLLVLLLPVLAVPLARLRELLIAGVVVTAVGRALLNLETPLTPTTGAIIATAGGLLYFAMLVRHRAQTIPLMLCLTLAADQMFRAVGNTFDPSWSASYRNIQLGVSAAAVLISLLSYAVQGRSMRGNRLNVTPDQGLLPFTGGIGFGALLFLQVALLNMPNAIAGRANTDYTSFVPALMAATLLPLVPWVRGQARAFIALFDSSVRGWIWMLLIGLLIVIGTRFQGVIGGAALVAAQFCATLLWWWLVRPRGEKERSLGGLWLAVGMLLFALLVAADLFTYNYAYVRSFAREVDFLNYLLLPLIRGFRGMGLAVLLVTTLLAALPMIQARRRLPWLSGTQARPLLTGRRSLAAFALTAAMSVGAAYAARPPLVQGLTGVEALRIGTYNIHAGFSEFFTYELSGIADAIVTSGVDVVLLQEIEAGRLTSFGVDQPLWLARRLGMDVRFYATNEGLHGLAVLSRTPIVFDDGFPLTSVGQQTGVQRVQVRPNTDVDIVTIYNTWLGLLVQPINTDPNARAIAMQEQDQQRQLGEILSLIRLQDPNWFLARLVIGGTFNNIPDSPLLDELRGSGYCDPFADLPLEITATLRRTGQIARLDYLWTLNLDCRGGTGVIRSSASDHELAFAFLDLTP